MRKFLLVSLFVMLLLSAAIVVFALVMGRNEIMLLVILPVGLFVLILFPYLILAIREAAKGRPQGMADAAAQLGFEYSARASAALKTKAQGFQLMEIRGITTNEIRGERDGASIYLFDHEGSDEAAMTYLVVLIAGKLEQVPNFQLRSRTVWQQLRTLFGKQEIEFAGSLLQDNFSRQFVVFTPENQQQVRDFFDDSLLQNLLAGEPVNLEVQGGTLMAWREPSIRRDLIRASYSIRENTASDAQSLFDRAMEIHAALMQRSADRR